MFNDERVKMFDLYEKVSRNNKTTLEDTANVKTAMTALGYYDDTETGLSPYADDQLYQSVQSFQKDNDLKVDGVLNPKGPTETKIKEKLEKDTKAGNAFFDFTSNRRKMIEADTIGADKYFHCVANYKASKQGWDGKIAAKILSNLRELSDTIRKKGSDSAEDQVANITGRKNAKLKGYKSAQEACDIFRPKGLDEKY